MVEIGATIGDMVFETRHCSIQKVEEINDGEESYLPECGVVYRKGEPRDGKYGSRPCYVIRHKAVGKRSDEWYEDLIFSETQFVVEGV